MTKALRRRFVGKASADKLQKRSAAGAKDTAAPALPPVAQLDAVPNPADARVADRVRLFAVLGTWMEADVVADNVRNALAQGCERVYLVDNGSKDDTVERAVAAGAVLARTFVTAQYDEELRLRHMNDVVAEVSAQEPDESLWWLFLDADEFAHGPSGLTLLEYLRTLDVRFRVVGARFFNHYPGPPPHYVPGKHPLEVQPLCEELPHPMCASNHRKHPLIRWDRSGPPVAAGRGFHQVHAQSSLVEPELPVFLHHFPFREEESTRQRLTLMFADNGDSTRARPGDDATGHMLPRFRSLEAVYAGDWDRVENFMPGRPPMGVTLRPWRDLVEPQHHKVRDLSSLAGAWKYSETPKFHYGDDTTYRKGIAFLDGHGLIEDWGCGFVHAREFVKESPYRGIDGSSPQADRIVDLCEYRSDADCVFMRHILEHNYEWPRILEGALASFRKRMVLILFTPFADTTHALTTSHGLTSVAVPDIAFRKEDLTQYFDGLTVSEESLHTDSQYGVEHIFYLER